MYHSLMYIAPSRDHIPGVGTPWYRQVTNPTPLSRSGAVTAPR